MNKGENIHMEKGRNQTELAKVIRERRAVKKGYNNKKVTAEAVLELLEDAIWAPTHVMRQSWRFIFVGEDQKADIAKKVAASYPEERKEKSEASLNEQNEFLDMIMY